MMNVKLVGITKLVEENGSDKPERLIARAGRVCYRSSKEGEIDSFIRARIRQGHESVIEHTSLSFEISGISRSCLAQLTRHRIASYSVESMRRVDMKEAKFVVPPGISNDRSAGDIFEEAVECALDAYERLRALGVKKEDCRFILPIATETKLVMTANVRSLRHIFTVRCAGPAQWEIRMLAERMLKIAYRAVPAAFEDLYTMYLKGKDY